jgi:hypothetical protein
MATKKNGRKKLSIEDFKASASKKQEALSKIVGGILATCHTVATATDAGVAKG